MYFSLVCLLALLGPAAAPNPPGTQLVYRGQFVPVKDDGQPRKKTFDLTFLVVSPAANGAGAGDVNATTCYWTLEESGPGAWHWLDHVGRWTFDPRQRDDGSTGPALLYQREDGKSVVPIFQPLFSADKKLESGQTWLEGRVEFRVAGESKIAGRNCWEVDVRTPFGHKRTLWLEKESSLIVAVRETVFLGQGQQHELKWELTAQEQLAAEPLSRAADAFEAVLKLRESLGETPRAEIRELSDLQLAALRKNLPAVVEKAEKTPAAALAVAAAKDLQNQKRRAGAVAALREKIIGQPLGELKLSDLSGKEFTIADLKDKVTVLHFWQYRDVPLEEPYGQVAYLDFILRRRAAKGVQVVGVHVDERLSEPDTQRASISSAKKFKAFFNLTYPVLLDDGQFLKRLGDPRVAGGKLPLFIVVGRDGKIVEYHAGIYDVKPEQGLAELDAIIGKSLKTGE